LLINAVMPRSVTLLASLDEQSLIQRVPLWCLLHSPNGALGRANMKYGLQYQPTETMTFLVENEILQIPGFICSGTVPYPERSCRWDAPQVGSWTCSSLEAAGVC